MDDLESLENNYYQSMEQCDHTLQALRNHEEQLEEAAVLNDQVKTEQDQEVAAVMQELEQLRVKQSTLPPEVTRFFEFLFVDSGSHANLQLTQLDRQHREELAKLEQIRNQLTATRSEIEQTQNDLLFGVEKYKMLGLEFHSLPSRDGLNFIFTQIDARNPMKQFRLAIRVDDAGLYHVLESEPALNSTNVAAMLARLNIDQNLGRFVASVRRLFKQTV